MENPEEKEIELSCELQDILNRIKAYNITNPRANFVFAFLGLEEDKENLCPDCNENCCEKIKENSTTFGACGDIETIRGLLNELRDIAEDTNEDGIVNF